MQHWWA